MTVRAEGQGMPGWVSVITAMTDDEIANAVASVERHFLEREEAKSWTSEMYIDLDLIQRLKPRSERSENTVFVVCMNHDYIRVDDTLGDWVVSIDPDRLGGVAVSIMKEMRFHLRQLRDERRRELGVEM